MQVGVGLHTELPSLWNTKKQAPFLLLPAVTEVRWVAVMAHLISLFLLP